MTVRLFFARALPGVVGETRRVVHVFPVPEQDSVPDQLTAFCSESFGPGELELLDSPAGMPCESCLQRTPSSASESSEEIGPPLLLSAREG